MAGTDKRRRTESGHTRRRTLLDKKVAFPVTEAYKNLRTNLTFALSTKKNRIFAVSSALAAEGKSTVAANIAITLAQSDNKVLLIDGDLRKPVQHRVFGVKNDVGISSLLGGLNSFREVVQTGVIDGLDLVTCGPVPPNPSELLGSDNMKALLEQLSSRYDYIIIDTPPIKIVTDALTLQDSIAGILLVVKHSYSTYDAVGDAVEAVKMADGSLLGVVVNDISVAGGRYGGKYSYKYKYGYRYGYGSYGGYGDRGGDSDD